MAPELSESNVFSHKNNVKRFRATNFNVNETLLLEELVKKNFEVLNSKFTNQVTNARKSEIWKEISSKISALGYAQRSEQACVEKWANFKRKAKEDLTKDKLEGRKTGDGPCVGVSQQSQRIGDLLSSSSAFSGIEGGLDTFEQGYAFQMDYLSNSKDCDLQQETRSISEALKSPLPAASTSSIVNQKRIDDTAESEHSSFLYQLMEARPTMA